MAESDLNKPQVNPFDSLLSDLIKGQEKKLKKSEFAERYFLNPQPSYAVKDDPTGEWHLKELQLANPDGTPIKNLKKDDPIPLSLRWYQKEMLDDPSRFRVYRCGRRTGKSFVQGCEAVVESLMNPNAKILVLAPNESHVKVLFDEYIRPLLKTYRHNKSGRVGIPVELGGKVPQDCDFVITKDTQKPQQIVITDGKRHHATITGMVISNAARGQSANLLVFDEADYADTEAVQGIVAPIIMTRANTRVVMSSTPTGRRDSFYYEKCHDSDWSPHHHTFEVLPHYGEKLHKQMAKLSGGESTNTFIQEYLAEFGAQSAGVFDQKALNKSFIVAPYCSVMEDVHITERRPLLAADTTNLSKHHRAYYEGVQPVTIPGTELNDLLGAESIYRPEYRGHGRVVAGTDWNDVAGMQTVIMWFPPEQWLREGRIEVARFEYNKSEPIVTGRAKDNMGHTKKFKVGHTNGPPGNIHDLSHVKGIVIWHGRLESGYFSWASAANRVASILAIPDFIDAWYVDYGYGTQVNSFIEGIMASGQYLPDPGGLTEKAQDITPRAWNNIKLFDPQRDPVKTQKLYRTVRFGDVYKHTDIDFGKRDDRYKDILVNVAKRAITGHEILLPYGQVEGYVKKKSLGELTHKALDKTGKVVEIGVPITNKDNIEPTGADPARGERSFGGLITQMREWRVAGVSPTGRPRYAGADHAIDAFMLALLAWYENFSEEAPGNIFKPPAGLSGAVADDLLDSAVEASKKTRTINHAAVRNEKVGDFNVKNYSSETPVLNAIRNGSAQAEKVGTSLQDMLKMASKHLSKKYNT